MERKHCKDKFGEKNRTTSVAKASRDGFVREWRLMSRGSQLDPAQSARRRAKMQRRLRFSNLRSVALERRTDLFPRHVVSGSGKKPRVIEPNDHLREEALQEYIASEKTLLQEEVNRRREVATASVAGATDVGFNASHGWPASRHAWLQWFSKSEESFRHAMRAVREGSRRHVNARLEAAPDLLGMDMPPRLEAQPTAARPSWANRVRQGVYCAHCPASNTRFVFIAVTIAQEQAVLPLHRAPDGQGFVLPSGAKLSSMWKRWQQVLPGNLDLPSVKLYRMDFLARVGGQGVLIFTPQRLVELHEPARRRPAHGQGVQEEADSDESIDTEASSKSWKSNSEVASFCSAAASDEESHDSSDEGESVAALSSDEQHDGAREHLRKPRRARGTHVQWENTYFTLTNNLGYPDMRVTIKPQWMAPEFLGSRNASRTLRPSRYGDHRTAPDEVILAFKSWMLLRMMHNGFHMLSGRYQVWLRELHALQTEVDRRGGLSALHVQTRADVQRAFQMAV